jgi:phage baseplate assembly protein W
MRYINISFPFRTGTRGLFLEDDGSTASAVKSNLLHLLLTNKGERIYFPRFGANLRKHLFEPNDQKNADDVRREIAEAVKDAMPEVTVTGLKFERQGRDLLVSIPYTYQDGVLTRTDTIFLNFGGSPEPA